MGHLISPSLNCQENHTENGACIQNKELQLTGESPVITQSPSQIVCSVDGQQPVATLNAICNPFWFCGGR